MNKSILAPLLAIIAIVLTSCSSDPWVGKWRPDNDRNVHIIIKSNGSVEWVCDADDGSWEMDGKWSIVENQENTIEIDFDSSSISMDIDNPLTAAIIKEALMTVAEEGMTLTVSEDGDFLHAPGVTNKGFIRY